MLAAAGVTAVAVHARPRVAIVSTGDEVVPPDHGQTLDVGQVRDASGAALAALVREAGGEPVAARDRRPTTRDALDRRALREAVAERRPRRRLGRARRSARATRPPPSSPGSASRASGATAIAIRPGKPTLLADAGGVPVIGLPGNPRSALVVFRLIGMPRRARGRRHDAAAARAVACARRLARNVPSAAGRLDVVQVAVRDGMAEPLFGASALLSILTAADGYVVVPDDATGLAAGTEVDVTLYR